MSQHEKYINYCIQIAKNGLGFTRPNPMVGSIIVYKNTIIGEGYTSPYGGNHAEVNAINSIKNKSLLKNATLYVTLEPCSHYGKTPPCSDLIIKHQIPNVVVGCLDENKKVAGKGIEKLENAGCKVILGVLEEECKKHHKRFLTFYNKKRPYIILKWAETLDGFIAPKNKKELKPVWITNALARQLVHKWRAEEQAILVGANTVLQDNPTLTVRDWTGQNPIRIVLDKKNSLSKDLNIFNNEAETLIIGNKKLKQGSKMTHFIDWHAENHITQQIIDILYQHNINSVIVEGGAKTLQTFIDVKLWDEARVFTGDTYFKNGIKAPTLSSKLVSEHAILKDLLKVYLND